MSHTSRSLGLASRARRAFFYTRAQRREAFAQHLQSLNSSASRKDRFIRLTPEQVREALADGVPDAYEFQREETTATLGLPFLLIACPVKSTSSSFSASISSDPIRCPLSRAILPLFVHSLRSPPRSPSPDDLRRTGNTANVDDVQSSS